MRSSTPRKRLSLLVIAVACGLTVAVSACGGSGSNSSTSGGGSTGASTSASSSGAIDLPKKTIAYGEIAAVDEVTNRNVTQMQAVAKSFGWDLKYTNAQGDVAKLNAALLADVNAGVDAIVVGSTDAALIRPALLAAKQKGIPAIVIGGGIGADPLYAAQYTEDEPKMSTLLTEQMVKDLGGKGTVGAMEIAQLTSGLQRKEARTKVLQGTGVKVVDSQPGDLADPIQGTKKIALSMLSQHPSLSAFWLVYDYMMPPTTEVLKQQGNSSTSIYTWFAGPENVRLLKSNKNIKALVEDNFDHTALIAMDQLAAHFKSNAALDPNAITACPLKYAVVEKSTAPPANTLKWPIAADRAPFEANWKAGTFGKGADCG